MDIIHGRKQTVRGDNATKLAMGLDWTVEQLFGETTDAPPPPQPVLDLTSAEFEDIGRACVAWMKERANDEAAFRTIAALLEVVRQRHNNVEPRYLDSLRSQLPPAPDRGRS